MSHKPTITAVIPSWNRREELRACLDSLRKQQGVMLEIVVADDGSTDGTLEMVKEEFPEVVVVSGGQHLGPGYRRNQGLLAGHGDYVLQLDSDSEFGNPSAIANMAAILAACPDVGSVGGEIAAHAKDFDHVHALAFDRMDRPQRVTGNREEALECDYLATLCCMMRRRDVQRLGGYDPYGRYGGEDADLGYRLKCAGFRNMARFDCAALHHASSLGRHEDSSYRYCVAWWRFVVKHRGVGVFLFRAGWYAANLLVSGLLFPFSAIRTRARRARIHKLSTLLIVLRAAAYNLRHVRGTLANRDSDYLSASAMNAFLGWKG